jgi:hypothetical protein
VLVTKEGEVEIEVESDEDKARVLLNTFFPPVLKG